MKSCRRLTLFLLGLFIQASSTANTTKMYYFELQIESTAYDNFTTFLKLIEDVSIGNATLKSITITTDCNLNNCTCNQNYTWSTDVCRTYPECCQSQSCAAVLPGAMCLYQQRVIVNGSFTMKDIYFPVSADQLINITKNLTTVFSTITWFDSLNITSLRSGSIIGEFVMLINGPLNVTELEESTKNLERVSINIITTGFIQIDAPGLTGYDTTANIICNTPTKLDSVAWYLQKNGQKQSITNGTEATVTINSLSSMVSVNKTSEVWKGVFICDYTSSLSTNIVHRGSAYLDVALLPHIFMISTPQFPNCITEVSTDVIVMCIIDNSTEPYNVAWFSDGLQKASSIQPSAVQTTYSTTFKFSCSMEEYNVTCTFTNRKNNTINETLNIPLIKAGSLTCEKNGDWPEAKANYTAKLQCNTISEVGFKSRACTETNEHVEWQNELSHCVDSGIHSLLTDVQALQKGAGLVDKNADKLFDGLRKKTEDNVINTFMNINISVYVLDAMHIASEIQNSPFNTSIVSDFVKTSSNLLNETLLSQWNSNLDKYHTLPTKYLSTFEGLLNRINASSMNELHQEANVQMIICNISENACSNSFNITLSDNTPESTYQAKFMNLNKLLPEYQGSNSGDYILSVSAKNASRISMQFPNQRLPNHKIFCVYLNFTTNEWSEDGCEWGGVFEPYLCKCEHLTTFTAMMSKIPVELKYNNEITAVGLGFSVGSLVVCLAVEFVAWNTVVKSKISHFRHTVLVNIGVCLLIAHSSFLATYSENSALKLWCFPLTIMKHFCFLAVFFWMLCMSLGLLHQMIFVFIQLQKKVYLGLCFLLGYICPLLIVICTVISFENGKLDTYYVNATCWLKYEGVLRGSIYTFVIPVGIIVIVNMFTMVVVIIRILKLNISEEKSNDEKENIRIVIRTVVLLTPTLGITWIFGFFVLILDLTMEPYAQIVNYAFTFFNSFQGFFILLTGCLGDKKVRDALLMRIRSQNSAQFTSKSSVSMTTALKKK